MKKLLLSLFLLGAVLSSCVKMNDPGVTPEKLSDIVLGKDTLTMQVGETRQIDVTLTPATYDKSLLVWTSSDTSVLKVTNNGSLTAKKAGSVTVTIKNTAATLSVSALVNVVDKPVVPRPDSLKIGLIAYYPFNYDSAIDSSGKGNDGTIYDITSIPDRFGKENRAYYFNGNTSYIRIKDNQDLRLNNTDFTINYWVNLDQYSSSYGSIMACKRGQGSSNGWITGIGGQGNLTNGVGIVGTATFNVSGGTDPFAFGKHPVSIHQWHMITVEYSFNKQQLSIFVDGVLDTATDNIPTPNGTTTSDLFIGADSQGTYNPDASLYAIKGQLDDIRIYRRCLSNTDIQILRNLTY